MTVKNPYVMLGVPYGASRDTATAAFARRARGLRRQPNGTERLRDLTWALNQVQETALQPELALDVYRVPADPGALEPDGDGLLRPPPELMSRGVETTTEWRQLLGAVLEETVRAVREDVADHAALPPR